MKKYGLLGKGIDYSLSPKLHKLIFNKLSIEAEYVLFDKDSSEKLEEEYIQEILKKIRTKEIEGINITIPYKEKIIQFLDDMEESTRLIGAVNTIVLENGNLKGYNTDYYGVIETFKRMNLKLKGKNIYILGTGGASKAVVKAVLDLGGVPRLVSRERKNLKICDKVFFTLLYEELDFIKKEYLLIDTTPIPLSKEMENKFENIFQMKYYLNEIKENKKNYENGFYMLVVQGIKSEEIWQNKKIGSFNEIYMKMVEELKNEKSSS